MVTDADLIEPPRLASPVTMMDLEQVIASPALLPPDLECRPPRAREHAFQQPDLPHPIRVSTDPIYNEQNAETVEFWSPSNPTFPPPPDTMDQPDCMRLATLLAPP